MHHLFLILLALFIAAAAAAEEARVTIHSARPFGYFVGDLIYARVEVIAPADATIAASSLPRPGPLSVWLDLREVNVHVAQNGVDKRFDIDLVYQNFYVALDVRTIEIPALNLRIGDETVTVPAWRVGVAPLREIAPTQPDRSEDYMRPDARPLLIDAARPRMIAVALIVLTVLALGMVAFDCGWPPFPGRRARIFSRLARQLSAQARARSDPGALTQAIRSMHRAIDAANGASLLSEDLPSFVAKRPEFRSLYPSFERFFAASRGVFFSEHDGRIGDYGFAELISFARALARQERRQ